ncbi:MAG: PAS domain S-box protein [Phycisphaerae bacterium]|nr:PAS domain S-box protein [Phycisphaerae bacterium]
MSTNVLDTQALAQQLAAAEAMLATIQDRIRRPSDDPPHGLAHELRRVQRVIERARHAIGDQGQPQRTALGTTPSAMPDRRIERCTAGPAVDPDEAATAPGATRPSEQKDRAQPENPLREAIARYQRLEANIPGMVYCFAQHADGSFSFPYANAGARTLFGIEPEALMRDASLLADIIHPDDRERFNESIRRSAETLQPWHLELRFIVGSDTRWYAGMSRPQRQPNGDVLWDGIVLEITDRRRVEEEQARLAAILEATSDIVSSSTPDRRLLYMNQAGKRLFGLDAKIDLCKVAIVDFHPAWAADRILNTGIPHAIEHGVWTGETAVLGPDGSEIPVSQVIMAHRSLSGELTFLSTIMRDIRERKQIEQALRAKSEEIERYFDTALDLFCVADTDGYFRRLNRQWEATLGYSLSDLEGRRFLDFVHPDDIEATLEAVAHLTRQEQVLCFVNRYRCKDGTYRQIEWRSFPAGKTIYAAARDITDRVQTTEELHESEEKLQTLFRGVTDAIILHEFTESRPGRIIEVNDQATTMLGYSREELLTMSIGDIDDPDSTVDVAPVTRKLTAGEDVLFEQWHRSKDGRRIPVEVHVQAFEMAGRPVALSLVRDITDRKRAEEERERLEAQLRQSQKMEAVGQLAGGVAHDFNNILTAIFGNVELANLALDSEPNPNPRLVESLHQIRQSSRRAAALTRQLLAFSRRQISQPQALDLNHTLTEMQKMLGRLITENITLHFTLAPDLRTTLADPGQIEQIVMNLVVNARDAMPDGGHLTIETRNVTLDAGFIASCPELSVGDYVVLAVSDTGTGMDEATAERIFEPFFTTKAIGSGTGLGLAMVYGIVHQAGGHVTVNSRLGQGTTFTIYLPVVDQVAEEKRAQAIAEPAPTGTETILLCEDNDPVRELTGNMLRAAGYTVLMACHGRDAIEIASSHAGPIHLLVTDVIMPDMHGKAVAEELGTRWPTIKVLYISGYPSNVIAHHGVLDEGVEFLEKPFTRHSLLTRVREVLTA